MIRIDAVWLAVDPIDMRAGAESRNQGIKLLARHNAVGVTASISGRGHRKRP